jgi:hypothetical protein
LGGFHEFEGKVGGLVLKNPLIETESGRDFLLLVVLGLGLGRPQEGHRHQQKPE